jgi:hypothetical protein
VRIVDPDRPELMIKIGLFIRSTEDGILSSRWLGYRLLEFETGRDRVLVKHANRIEREFVEVSASEFD